MPHATVIRLAQALESDLVVTSIPWTWLMDWFLKVAQSPDRCDHQRPKLSGFNQGLEERTDAAPRRMDPSV